jgi:hypothetical protein
MSCVVEFRTKNGTRKATLTPLKAIRQKCLDCSNWQTLEIRLCQVPLCPLFSFRFGTNPNRKGFGGTFNHLRKEKNAVTNQKQD